jgi:hypothetical protein
MGFSEAQGLILHSSVGWGDNRIEAKQLPLHEYSYPFNNFSLPRTFLTKYISGDSS